MASKQKLGEKVQRHFLRLYPKRLRYFNKHPITAVVIFLLLYYSINIALSLHYGVFSNSPEVETFTEDAGVLLVPAILSAAIYYYFCFPTLLRTTFDALLIRGIFVSTPVKISNRMQGKFKSRRPAFLGPALSLCAYLASILWLLNQNEPTSWWYLNPTIIIIGISVLQIAWVPFFSLLVNYAIAILLIRDILEGNEIQVYRLSVDRSGGFGPLGQFSLRVVFFAFSYGIFLAQWAIHSTSDGTIGTDYALFFNVTLYAVLVPTFFYLPLSIAHQKMAAFREKLVHETSRQYLREHLNIHEGKLPKLTKLEEQVKHMAALQVLVKHELDYPVWPFSTRIRLTVLLNSLIPAVPTIIGILLGVATLGFELMQPHQA
jgi:hypothetical protein